MVCLPCAQRWHSPWIPPPAPSTPRKYGHRLFLAQINILKSEAFKYLFFKEGFRFADLMIGGAVVAMGICHFSNKFSPTSVFSRARTNN